METPTIISFADREKNGELGPAAPANTCTGAEEFIDLCGDAPDSKPRLLIESCSPDRTVAALRDVLSKSGLLYERAVPIRLAYDAQQHCTIAQPITPDGLVLMAHEICRPYAVKRMKDGSVEEVNIAVAQKSCRHVSRLAGQMEFASVARHLVHAVADR